MPIIQKRQFLPYISALLILVLGIGAGLGVRWLQTRHKGASYIAAPKLPANVDKSQDLALSGDLTKAQAVLNDALAKATTSQEKYDLLYQQGANYQNGNDYANALKSYLTAESYKSTQSLSESIATLAQMMNNKDLAIQYFKKAISQVSSTDPVGASVIQGYKQHIVDLGGQP